MTRQVTDIELVGGHPAVDFVNTVQNWTTGDARDYLPAFADFLAWNRRVGLLWAGAAKHFQSRPAREQQAALEDARALRGDLHDLFAAMANGERLPQEALDHLNTVIRRTVTWRCLAADRKDACRSLCCVWEFREAPADAALGPVAWKASELLELGDTDRLKICPSDNCGWLFIDTSKNRSRTWCSMRACGNAAKVRRFRARQKSA
jgi:predicted RNA-binding Zn ribbon-like protein